MNSSLKHHLLCLLLGVCSIVVYFSPVLWVDTATTPSTYPDSWAFIWNIWRFGEVIAGRDQFYSTHLIFHPTGTSLGLHTQAEGVLFPLTYIFQGHTPYQIYTLACFLCIILNFLCSYWLFSSFASSVLVILPLSLILTYHPFFIGHLDAGHINFSSVFPCTTFCAENIFMSSEG